MNNNLGSSRQGALTAPEEPRRAKRALWNRLARIAKSKPLGTAAASIILGLVLMAIFDGFLAPYDPTQISAQARLAPPSSQHLMGGDHLGRDILSNIIRGARLSLFVGIVSVAIGTVTGCIIGTVSAYFGGKVDFTAQRFVDTLLAFPSLVLTIAIVTFLGANVINVVIAIGITSVAGTSRVIRGSVLSVKENKYVEAARASGCSDLRIMALHVMPNVMAPIVILASIALGSAVLAESSLSFLGLGVPPPVVSWGRMLGGASIRYMTVAPWVLIFPGLAITIVVLAFNLLGDTVRDVFDPRLRGAGRL